jgi:hypothetical protein
LKTFQEIQLCYDASYKNYGIRTVIHNPRPMIYILKPRVNQQDALWNIIDYMRHKEEKADQTEVEEEEAEGEIDHRFA